MGFSFRLERILQLRRQKENEEMRKLSSAQKLLQEAQTERDRLLQEQLEHETELRTLQQSGRASHTWALYHRHLAHIGQKIIEAEKEIILRQEILTQQRTALIEATQERKVLERLREKQLEDYRLEELRKEQIDLDDIAGKMHRKQKGDG